MASTENTTVGIKAIKVSKLDADGINQNSQLQEGDLISLSFQDLGIQRFIIQSISEFSNYYLYYVNPVSLGTNNSDFDEPQNVSGTGTGVINAGNYELQGTGGGLVNGKRFADFNLVDNNTNWTFTDSAGIFSETIGLGGNRFGITVNYEVNVYTDSPTPGISFGIFPSGSGYLVTYNNDVTSTRSEDTFNGNVVSLKGSVYGPGQTRTIRGSFNIVASNTTTNFGIIPVSYYSGAKFFFPTSSISFNITSLTTSSTDVDGLNTVIEPYTSDVLAVSDYNALINNATSSRINEFYMDVDYSSDAIVAVNSDTILNGSATRATVQYSNYTSERVTRPRYDGSKNTSPNLNQGEGNSLPAIEQTKSYFLYSRGGNFNSIADRSGSGLYQIGFMIDDLGNTYEPQESESAYLPNLLSGFGQGSKVTFVPTDTGSQVAGTYDVHFPARKIKPIIYSDTGSLGNTYLVSGSYSTIDFIPDPNQFSEFRLFTYNSNNVVVSSNSSKRYEPDGILIDEASGWGYNQFGQLQYYVSQSSNVLATLDLGLQCTNSNSGTFKAKIYKSGSASPIAEQTVLKGSSGTLVFDIVKTIKLEEESAFYVEIENTGSGNLTVRNFDLLFDSSSFAISPDTSTITVNTADSWLTGSNQITSVITASQNLAKAYNYVQANIPGSGFQYPILFNLQQYDEIRYNGDEQKVFLIDRVDYEIDYESNPTEYNLHVYFTEPVDTTRFDKDYYVFRRNEFQKDAMIINGPGEVMQQGFILPEFQSPALKENLSNIIQNLTDKGLISTN